MVAAGAPSVRTVRPDVQFDTPVSGSLKYQRDTRLEDRVTALLEEARTLNEDVKLPDLSASPEEILATVKRLRAASARLEGIQLELQKVQRFVKAKSKLASAELLRAQAAWYTRKSDDFIGRAWAIPERVALCETACLTERREVLLREDQELGVQGALQYVKDISWSLRSLRDDLRLLLGIQHLSMGIGDGGPDSMK
jgi:hypothetical protein